jgi:hypothetical protein
MYVFLALAVMIVINDFAVQRWIDRNIWDALPRVYVP